MRAAKFASKANIALHLTPNLGYGSAVCSHHCFLSQCLMRRINHLFDDRDNGDDICLMSMTYTHICRKPTEAEQAWANARNVGLNINVRRIKVIGTRNNEKLLQSGKRVEEVNKFCFLCRIPLQQTAVRNLTWKHALTRHDKRTSFISQAMEIISDLETLKTTHFKRKIF